MEQISSTRCFNDTFKINVISLTLSIFAVMQAMCGPPLRMLQLLQLLSFPPISFTSPKFHPLSGNTGIRGRSRLLKMASCNSLYTVSVSYSHFIVTMALCSIVSEIKRDIGKKIGIFHSPFIRRLR